jgi:uncharacterized protein YceH (UPF0502 family)
MDHRVEVEEAPRRTPVDFGHGKAHAVRLACENRCLERGKYLPRLFQRGVDPEQAPQLAMLRLLERLCMGAKFGARRAPRPGVDAGDVVGAEDGVVDARRAALGKCADRLTRKIGDRVRLVGIGGHDEVYASRMIDLTPDECRVLGTLIEKALTTPAQYPLSLNSLVTGVNQKSNRDPVVEIDDDRALTALDGLRTKGLVRDVSFTGARVEKFRHLAGEALEVRAPEMAILAELLLRGPQTSGELRARATRMAPFDSIEAVEGTLETLSAAERGLVRKIAPSPGSRAPRWVQCLCATLHPLGDAVDGARAGSAPADGPSTGASAQLEARVAQLEARVAELTELLGRHGIA